MARRRRSAPGRPSRLTSSPQVGPTSLMLTSSTSGLGVVGQRLRTFVLLLDGSVRLACTRTVSPPRICDLGVGEADRLERRRGRRRRTASPSSTVDLPGRAALEVDAEVEAPDDRGRRRR